MLAFYLEAGVDCALMDEPVNRLADPDAAAPPRETVVREAPPSKIILLMKVQKFDRSVGPLASPRIIIVGSWHAVARCSSEIADF